MKENWADAGVGGVAVSDEVLERVGDQTPAGDRAGGVAQESEGADRLIKPGRVAVGSYGKAAVRSAPSYPLVLVSLPIVNGAHR